MANLKDIRNRIKTVKSTQQVTKAMKMVAAAKLRRAQDRMLQLRPYASKLREIIGNVIAVVDAEDIPSRLVEQRDNIQNVLVIHVTSNRGLAGPFNTNINKAALAFLQENHPDLVENGKVQLMCLGRKGYDFFRKRGFQVNGKNFDVFQNLSFGTVNEVVDIAFEKFLSGEVDRVYVSFNEFKNVMSQIRRVEAVLPLSVESLNTGQPAKQEGGLQSDYLYEPGQEVILSELIPKVLRIQVFRAVLESNAAEQGARMVAMDKATENAEDLLKSLRISYNKARQASITKEILEIVAGANALEGA